MDTSEADRIFRMRRKAEGMEKAAKTIREQMESGDVGSYGTSWAARKETKQTGVKAKEDKPVVAMNKYVTKPKTLFKSDQLRLDTSDPVPPKPATGVKRIWEEEGKWCAVSVDGRRVGTYSSRNNAQRAIVDDAKKRWCWIGVCALR